MYLYTYWMCIDPMCCLYSVLIFGVRTLALPFKWILLLLFIYLFIPMQHSYLIEQGQNSACVVVMLQ